VASVVRVEMPFDVSIVCIIRWVRWFRAYLLGFEAEQRIGKLILFPVGKIALVFP
jgi:hypothetical protein